MMRWTLLLAGALAFTTVQCDSAAESGTLSGTVVAGTDEPLFGVHVTTVPPTTTVQTDSAGSFVIGYLVPRSYVVVAAKPGYLSDSAQATVRADETTSVSLSLRDARRRVAAEMIATICDCSKPEREGIYALKDTFGDRLVHVEYHATDDSLAYYWEPLINPAAETRRLYYAPDFHLGGWLYLDGKTEFRALGGYRRAIDSLLAVPSPVALDLSAVRTFGSQIQISLDLTAVQDFGPGVGVGVGLFEAGPFPALTGQGDTAWFRNVILDFAFLETLGMAAGETRHLATTMVIPDTLSSQAPPCHVVNQNDVGVFVLVQEFATKQVLQARQLKPQEAAWHP